MAGAKASEDRYVLPPQQICVDPIKFTLSDKYPGKFVTKEPDQSKMVSDLAETEVPTTMSSRMNAVPSIAPQETVDAMLMEPVLMGKAWYRQSGLRGM